MRKFLWIAFAVTILFTSLSAQLPDPQKVVSAKIETNQIKVTYTIPVGFHQTLNKDMFFIEVDKVEGITFEPTVYPKGKQMKDDSIEYHGIVFLTKNFVTKDNIVNKTHDAYATSIKVIFCFPNNPFSHKSTNPIFNISPQIRTAKTNCRNSRIKSRFTILGKSEIEKKTNIIRSIFNSAHII